MVTLSSGRGLDQMGVELGGAVGVLTSEQAQAGAVDGAWILGEIDRQHPVFSPFRVGAFSDFSGIRFWRHFPLRVGAEGGARVVASFEGGSPALVEVPVGKGRYLIWASGWKPSEGQWVLSSRCVPFLSGVLEWATGGRVALQQVFAGERLEVPVGTTRLRREDGVGVEVEEREVRLAEPGVYRMEPVGGMVVVNVAPEEKRVGVLEMEQLRAMGVPLEGFEGGVGEGAAATAGGAWRGAAAQRWEELESRQGGWRRVLWGVVFLAALETFWASRLSRKPERSSA